MGKYGPEKTLHFDTFYAANDSLKEALIYFENNLSIENIKSKGFDASFTFTDTSSSEVIKLIKTQNVK